jgi:hypothetical protein
MPAKYDTSGRAIEGTQWVPPVERPLKKIAVHYSLTSGYSILPTDSSFMPPESPGVLAHVELPEDEVREYDEVMRQYQEWQDFLALLMKEGN